jgi:hypothetical protein
VKANSFSKGFVFRSLVIMCVWAVFVFGAVYYTRHNNPLREKASKAQNSDSFIVGSIRVSIKTLVLQTKRIPSTLDDAVDGRASEDNPFFSFVLRSPVMGGWEKRGNEYISPSGKVYIYDDRTGSFLEGIE